MYSKLFADIVYYIYTNLNEQQKQQQRKPRNTNF